MGNGHRTINDASALPAQQVSRRVTIACTVLDRRWSSHVMCNTYISYFDSILVLASMWFRWINLGLTKFSHSIVNRSFEWFRLWWWCGKWTTFHILVFHTFTRSFRPKHRMKTHFRLKNEKIGRYSVNFNIFALRLFTFSVRKPRIRFTRLTGQRIWN